MIVTKALIIDSPWIEWILEGGKVWEMRSTRASHRGPFGLIAKGSGNVLGVANLDDVSGPYNNQELADRFEYHRVGNDLIENSTYKWRYAWELSGVIKLPRPVPYHHKNGAVTWVELDESTVKNIACSLGQSIPRVVSLDIRNIADAGSATLELNSITRVPIARDGSVFSSECGRNGVFTVGEKGDERRFDNFHEALAYLKSMPTAKWRRPNAKGNWGIVSAVKWV